MGLVVLLGFSGFTITLALYFFVSGLFDPLKKRVLSIKGGAVTPGKAATGTLLKSMGGLLLPKVDAKRKHVETLLRHSNFRSAGAIQSFYGFKLALMVLAPAVVLAVGLGANLVPLANAIPFALGAGVLGFLAPDVVLARIARRRQARLRRGLPDALDLLVVCSEAGLGLNAGIQRVGDEIAINHPDLSDELQLVTMQARAGMDNRGALQDLVARTGLEDIQALVATLLQSMRFGTSIAETLRIYSEELRDKRLQRAQEKAARVATLMLFPLVICIMPSFLLVILGPALLGAYRAFSGLSFGG
ncbi:MAG: type II secretion system F family protein [Pseudomonadota bacterium]|nr:type II secretion system F family protein [Pseudomonadota bacterium]